MDNNEGIYVPEENTAEKEVSVTTEEKDETVITTTAEDEKKKKSKTTVVITIAVLVPLISAFAILSVFGIFIISEIRSPEKAIMNMLEKGKYDEAVARYHHEFSEEGASEELIDMLTDRASELINEIRLAFDAATSASEQFDNIKESPSFNELKTIMDMDIPEVDEYISDKLLNELFKGVLKYYLPDSTSSLLDIPYIFENLP